jgi:hypothetical protein
MCYLGAEKGKCGKIVALLDSIELNSLLDSIELSKSLTFRFHRIVINVS